MANVFRRHVAAFDRCSPIKNPVATAGNHQVEEDQAEDDPSFESRTTLHVECL